MNTTCPYCQRDMDLDIAFAKMYSDVPVINYDCPICHYSIQIDKDQLTFGWFYCFVENEEYEIKFNFIQKSTHLYKLDFLMHESFEKNSSFVGILDFPYLLNISPYDATEKIKTILTFQ
jgi:hypothetical protein